MNGLLFIVKDGWKITGASDMAHIPDVAVRVEVLVLSLVWYLQLYYRSILTENLYRQIYDIVMAQLCQNQNQRGNPHPRSLLRMYPMVASVWVLELPNL